MDSQSLYQKAIAFAGERHKDQKIPGTEISYIVHLSNVAMEIFKAHADTPDFDLDFAIQTALLHDVLEDTPTSFEELRIHFGQSIAAAVWALSKNDKLKSEEQIPDSLRRIKLQPKEVWVVKLADRISNLQEPPKHWDHPRRIQYQKMAYLISETLKGGNPYLENRLREKIRSYNNYIDQKAG